MPMYQTGAETQPVGSFCPQRQQHATLSMNVMSRILAFTGHKNSILLSCASQSLLSKIGTIHPSYAFELTPGVRSQLRRRGTWQAS